jgi:hypothetical protein
MISDQLTIMQYIRQITAITALNPLMYYLIIDKISTAIWELIAKPVIPVK